MVDLDSLVKQYPENLKAFKRNILAEYLQCKALSVIYDGMKPVKLSFIGGTAIRLCHGSFRFSDSNLLTPNWILWFDFQQRRKFYNK